MTNKGTIHNILGVIGDVLSFILFLSPLPTYVTIWKRKDVENFSPAPYLATMMNCFLWVFYGLPVVSTNNLLVTTINSIGVILEAIYLILFFIYSHGYKNHRRNILLILAVEVVAMAAVVVGVLVGAHDLDKRRVIVGAMSVFFGLCMYASPLSVIRLVIKTKSVEYLPFYLCLAGLLNGACWTAYAIVQYDLFLLIPNGLGALLGALQVAIYLYYSIIKPAKRTDPEVQLSRVDA